MKYTLFTIFGHSCPLFFLNRLSMSAETTIPGSARESMKRLTHAIDDDFLSEEPELTQAGGKNEVLAEVYDLEGTQPNPKPEKQPDFDPKTISLMLTQLGLGIEDRVALLQNSTVVEVLRESVTVANQAELLADLEEATVRLQKKLESSGIKFDRDGSVVENAYYETEMHHTDSKQNLDALRVLFDLTDEHLGAIDHTTGGKGGRIEEPDELDFASYNKAEVAPAPHPMTPEEERRAEAGRIQDIKGLMVQDLQRARITGSEAITALDPQILEELSVSDYRGKMLSMISNAVDKVIRATENRAGFVLDQNGEPVLLSVWSKINIFTKGKKIVAARKSEEYSKLINLINLKEKLDGSLTITKKNLDETMVVHPPGFSLDRFLPQSATARTALSVAGGIAGAAGIGEGLNQLYQKNKAGQELTPAVSRGPDNSIRPQTRGAENEVSSDFLRGQRERIEELFKRNLATETRRAAGYPEVSPPKNLTSIDGENVELIPTQVKAAAKTKKDSLPTKTDISRRPKIHAPIEITHDLDLTKKHDAYDQMVEKNLRNAIAKKAKAPAQLEKVFEKIHAPALVTHDLDLNKKTPKNFLNAGARKKLSPELTAKIELAPDMKTVEKILHKAVIKEAKTPKSRNQLMAELNLLRKAAAEQAADDTTPEELSK